MLKFKKIKEVEELINDHGYNKYKKHIFFISNENTKYIRLTKDITEFLTLDIHKLNINDKYITKLCYGTKDQCSYCNDNKVKELGIFIPLIEVDNDGNCIDTRDEQLWLLPKIFLYTHYFNKLNDNIKDNINNYIFKIEKSMNKHKFTEIKVNKSLKSFKLKKHNDKFWIEVLENNFV